jgi:glutathione S-transferase
MTQELILHHHDPSPFAEKIRKVFGIKALSWVSVQVPMVMPKPDLTALTGGYRGTPVLQIGAHIYCDTRRIIAEIERSHSTPRLFRSGPLFNYALQHWSDDAFWTPGSALALYENAEHIPAAVSKDREDYFRNLDFERFEKDAPHFRTQIRAHAVLADRQLSDGRRFMGGDDPEWADCGVWHNIFMARGNIPSANDLFADLKHLSQWADRMEAFGHGDRTDREAKYAIAIAAENDPDLSAIPETTSTADEFETGDAVTVAPVEHPETAVTGILYHAGDDEIVISHQDERAGALAVHFPRIGYRIGAAG